MEENIFYDEVLNKLNQMQNSLIDAHETQLDKTEKINEIFRAVHTVKGVCDLLGFNDIVKLTHKSEDILDEVRKGNIEFSSNLFYLFMELRKFIEIAVTEILKDFDMSRESKNLLKSFEKEMIAYLPKSVLILDDSENLNDFAFLFEEKTKYKLLVKRSKYEALEAVDQNNVGVILCDIDNDTLGGVEILNDLKSHTKLIPSILLTQTPNAKLKEVGVSVGAKAWLKKPLDSEQAILVIEKILA